MAERDFTEIFHTANEGVNVASKLRGRLCVAIEGVTLKGREGK